MEPHVNTHNRPRMLSLRALLAVAFILLLSLSLGGAFEYLRSREQAQQQASEMGLLFGRSSSILIQPLILADDRISLNFLFNELTAQPLINGLRLTAPDETLIALAGQPQGRSHSLELVQGDEVIGKLTYWTNPAPFERLLHQQLLETGLLLGGSLLLTALVLAFSLRRPKPASTRPAPPTGPEAAPARTDTTAGDPDAIPAFNFDEGDAGTPEPAGAASPDRTAVAAEDCPEPAADQSTSPAAPDESLPAETEASAAPPREPRLDMDELVSLLKPEQDEARMPSFTPPAPPSDLTEDSDEAMVPDTEELALEEQAAEADTPRPHLVPIEPSDEEQLGLYSFEHELELMLTPEEAGYLFLIDTRSAHSDNVDEDERTALLKNYRILANSVARIYGGHIETLKDGNLRLLFTEADAKDSHGVNAICSAMLFTHLYKQYNQSQIRAFRPVMNLHMALVRGSRERVERMQEEAHFLTRTIQSNELISHTALTQAPLLKESLLQGADIRREDEDKVLILGISESYQALLEKQARHLLSKLSERQQEGES